MLSFIFTYSYLYCCSWFLHVDSSYCLLSFHISLKDPFSIFHSATLWAKNSLSFCLSENALISPSFLKHSFVGYRILH